MSYDEQTTKDLNFITVTALCLLIVNNISYSPLAGHHAKYNPRVSYLTDLSSLRQDILLTGAMKSLPSRRQRDRKTHVNFQ